MSRVLSLLFLFLFCIGCARISQKSTIKRISATDSVSVTDVRFASTSIDRMLWYRVIEPKVGPDERLPVLYLLHGANSSPMEIMDRSDVIKLTEASRLIVVLPEGDYSYYTNAKHKMHSRWEDAIALDLPRDVTTNFPVLQGREHTGIAGISMGGYGAVKLALKHPDTYGFVASMSGALDITRRPATLRRWQQTWKIWTTFGIRPTSRQDEDVFHLLDSTGAGRGQEWFLSCGENDPLRGINGRFAAYLRSHMANVNSIITPGAHDWRSWNAALPEVFGAAERSLR